MNFDPRANRRRSRRSDTEPTQPIQPTSAMPPLDPSAARWAPPSVRATPTPPYAAPRSRRDSGLYLPAWSVLLMFVAVFVFAFGIIGLVISLGGESAPPGTPRIVIVTAAPSPTREAGAATTAPTVNPLSITVPAVLPTFALEGPTLLPVILSPTPAVIEIGSTVEVNTDQTRLRSEPIISDDTIVEYLTVGQVFVVTGGPQSNSGQVWWQVQDPNNPARTGWIAGSLLDVVSP
jgi:hypothetical protein